MASRGNGALSDRLIGSCDCGFREEKMLALCLFLPVLCILCEVSCSVLKVRVLRALQTRVCVSFYFYMRMWLLYGASSGGFEQRHLLTPCVLVRFPLS